MGNFSNSLLLSLRDRAEAVIEARDKLALAYANGEDDPMTNEFKAVHATCNIAERMLAEKATPEIIRSLVNRIMYLESERHTPHIAANQ